MSRYKDQLKQILSEMEVSGDCALSVGNLHDDRKYFKKAEFKEWLTIDIDPELRPDQLWDMNESIVEEEVLINEDWIEKFDYLFALELFDYIWDPITVHRNIHSLLKPGGTFIGSYPFVYCKHNPDGKDMLRYTDDAIRKYLTMNGFREINIIPRHGNSLLEDFYAADGMRIKKEFDNSIIGWVVRAKK